MRAIILDDDKQILSQLRAMLHGEVEMLEQAESIDEARRLIDAFDPELVFIEAKLRSLNGLKLLDYYEEEVPFEFIVITKSTSYAIEAFQRFALDYVTKPLDKEELLYAVAKFKKNSIDAVSQINHDRVRESNKIALPTQDGFIFVRQSDIIRCEAHGNYTQVYLAEGGKLMITKTLKHYEELLSSDNFFRAHKSHLINLDFVRKFIKGKQSYIETMDGMSIEVSTRKREALLQKLSFSE